MRAGLSTIQQTLTPEAATVLNHSIAEASRRNHGQTTPLHVAATLLAAPSGFLRQACIRSHPNSSHPLQCRALELCFSVALERLPTAQNMPAGTEPPISNALMAALKRAQAHQRRGCPEQQQQPLLAVKVELEQLIISILDDPSVSRVMREASFSSPAVKATIEQSLNSSSNHHHHHHSNVNLGGFGGISTRILANPAQISAPGASPVSVSSGISLANQRNVYLNPRLQQGASGPLGNPRGEEVKRIVDILMRGKKRNPILVGEGELEALVKELFRKIEKGELDGGGEGPLKNVEIIPIKKEFLLDKNQIPAKIKELSGVIESRIGSGGVILDLGDLKWLVEQPVNLGVAGGQQQQQQVVSEAGRAAVVEMSKLLARFREGSGGSEGRIWLIGTATCETYLRCQVYHSTMENDWDLQAVPIASRSPPPGMFPRLGTDRTASNPLESMSPLKSFPTVNPALPKRTSGNLDPVRRTSYCPQCAEKYEVEHAKLVAEFDDSTSAAKSEAARATLPQWLQNARLNKSDTKTTDQSTDKDKEQLLKQKTQELQKKWTDMCSFLHPNFRQTAIPERSGASAVSMSALYNPKLLLHQSLQPKLQPSKNMGDTLQLSSNQVVSQPLDRPPRSPVKTDLVLGRKPVETIPEKTHDDRVKDFLGCVVSEQQSKLIEKFANALDADSYKKLLKGLMEKAWWQPEAASALASAVTRCRLGNGKRRAEGASRGDIWLLFAGPDRVGKRKMASVLSEQICGASPIIICLGSRRDDEESDTNFLGKTDTNFRGETALDRIAVAVRRNPFSVILLEDIDETDMLVRGSIKRAIERGRLTDSHGREISLGNVIFILTGNWSTINPEDFGNEHMPDEKKLASLSSGNWQLRLTIAERSAKRRANWLHDDPRQTKPRKEMGLGLSFDLNLAADAEDDRTDGSHNSSDLTVDHEEERGLNNRQFTVASVPHELVNSVDDCIVFKPVDMAFVRHEIKKTITTKFSMDVDEKVTIEVEEDVVERILGGLWHGRASLEEWVEKVLAPSFEQLKPRLTHNIESIVVRLQLEQHSENSRSNGDWLPSRITVMAGGL